MDNFQVDVTSTGRSEFELVMEILTRNIPGQEVVSYALHPKLGMVLFWSHEAKLFGEEPQWPPFAADVNQDEWRRVRDKNKADVTLVEVTRLPYPMKGKAIVDFAWNWLGVADRGPEPGFDGTTGPGWRVYTEKYGRVGNSHLSCVAIRPVWAMYGK